jgi:hypothetical protein
MAKKPRKLNIKPNQIISLIMFIVGLFITLTAIFVPKLTLGKWSEVVNVGIGITILISVVIFFLQNCFEYQNWKSENLLRYTILEKLIFEQLESMSNIRYEQQITLTLPDVISSDDSKFLTINCEHMYTYKNESLIRKNINIDIFNDIFLPKRGDNSNPYERTKFVKVVIKYSDSRGSIIYTPNEYPDQFKPFNGRPHFSEKIYIEANNSVTITYTIKNEFQKFSRLIWNIQELSQGVKLIVDNKSSYDLSRFMLAINHPKSKQIQDENKKYLTQESHLQTVEQGDDKQCIIDFDHTFLPYQGFELKWEL